MTAFALFRIGPMEHDLLTTLGLSVAVVLLGVLVSRYLWVGTPKRPKLVSVLALIGIATLVWSIAESATRLCQSLADQWQRHS